MKLTFEYELSEDTADIFGEYLRDQFFRSDLGYGCYSTFELRDDVTKLPDRIEIDPYDVYKEDKITWRRAQKYVQSYNVVMEYYWDGDGTLRFIIDNRLLLENTDCKKDDRWMLDP